MVRVLILVTILLSIALTYAAFSILVYQFEIPRLVWAVETLKLDFDAQRKARLACEKHMVPM